MEKTNIALIVIIFVVLSVFIFYFFIQQQYIFTIQNSNDNLQNEVRNLQDKNREFYNEIRTLKYHISELEEELCNLTKQLALERPLQVEINKFSPEDHWSDYGSLFGVSRARNIYNVTIQNNDVLTISGLELIVKTFSGNNAVGLTFSKDIDLLHAAEEREIEGESIIPIYNLKDLTYVVTLKLSDIVLDEYKLSLHTIIFS